MMEAAVGVLYQPTEKDRQLKIEFWQRTANNPLLDPSLLPMDQVESILGKPVNNRNKPGFSAWFMNRDENAQKLEYLFTKALDAAMEIICNTDPKMQSARVNMIKHVSELAAKIPSRGPQQLAGQSNQNLLSSINTMDQVQLTAFLQKNGNSVSITASKGQEPITVLPMEDAEE